MKVTVILTGKTEEAFLEQGIQKYLSRLDHYLKLEWQVLPPIKNKATLSKELLKAREGELILKKIKASDYVLLLDEKGKELSSSGLADYIGKLINNEATSLVIIVGGAFGVSDEIKTRSDFILSLSKMTFSHQMVRLFLVEQLYRAMTIIKGEKYHHE